MGLLRSEQLRYPMSMWSLSISYPTFVDKISHDQLISKWFLESLKMIFRWFLMFLVCRKRDKKYNNRSQVCFCFPPNSLQRMRLKVAGGLRPIADKGDSGRLGTRLPKAIVDAVQSSGKVASCRVFFRMGTQHVAPVFRCGILAPTLLVW